MQVFGDGKEPELGDHFHHVNASTVDVYFGLLWFFK